MSTQGVVGFRSFTTCCYKTLDTVRSDVKSDKLVGKQMFNDDDNCKLQLKVSVKSLEKALNYQAMKNTYWAAKELIRLSFLCNVFF